MTNRISCGTELKQSSYLFLSTLGNAAFPSAGTTNLHIDMSDAVNVMVSHLSYLGDHLVTKALKGSTSHPLPYSAILSFYKRTSISFKQEVLLPKLPVSLCIHLKTRLNMYVLLQVYVGVPFDEEYGGQERRGN